MQLVKLAFPLLVACGTTGSVDGSPTVDGSTPEDDQPDQPDAASPAMPGDAAACTWKTVPISTSAIPLESRLAFAISSTGERGIAYTAMVGGRHDLVVARGANHQFSSTPYGLSLIVDSYTDVSAAYTSAGNLRVAYANERAGDSTQGGVYYAPAPGSNIFVDGAGLLGFASGTDLAIGPDNRAHVLYTVTQPLDKRMVVASFTGNTPAISPAVVDPDLSGETAIAVDSAGRIHVSGRDSDPASIVYARRTGDQWTPPIVVADGTSHVLGADIAVTPANVVHIVRLANDRIIHSHGTPGNWQVTNIPLSSTSLDLTKITLKAISVDTAGQVHFAWTDDTGKVVYEALGKPPVIVRPAGTIRVRELHIAIGPTGPQLAMTSGTTAVPPFYVLVSRCE